MRPGDFKSPASTGFATRALHAVGYGSGACRNSGTARHRARRGRVAWRPGSESNRRTRICSPLHDHSATWPVTNGPITGLFQTEPPCAAPKQQTPAWPGSRKPGAGNETRTTHETRITARIVAHPCLFDSLHDSLAVFRPPHLVTVAVSAVVYRNWIAQSNAQRRRRSATLLRSLRRPGTTLVVACSKNGPARSPRRLHAPASVRVQRPSTNAGATALSPTRSFSVSRICTICDTKPRPDCSRTKGSKSWKPPPSRAISGGVVLRVGCTK